MKHTFALIIFASLLAACDSENTTPAKPALYFPPASTSEWETVTPVQAGWNEDAIDDLNTFVESTDTRALIVLKDGKIVFEKYNGKQFDDVVDFNANSFWYWASAGKTLTSSLVGIAENEGDIDFDASTSTYLGSGWSNLTTAQEDDITVRHQLTMTTGLDDAVSNPDCTDKECLIYKAEPCTRWAYHNAPYTILDDVVANATGKTLQEYAEEKFFSQTGISGFYLVSNEYNNVFYSTARSMARFGLLLLNKGKWSDTQVVPEDYIELLSETSQNINLSYGYLTWLNGKASAMAPQSQTVFPGFLTPNAPADMYAAMGKNGQLINVVPSLNLVVIRMGEMPGDLLVPFQIQVEMWENINLLIE